MSWSFKYVGNVSGLLDAMNKGGGVYNKVSGRLEVSDSYTRACHEIVNHLTLQTQAPEIGWQIEAWGGSASFHIDVQPVNLRISEKP